MGSSLPEDVAQLSVAIDLVKSSKSFPLKFRSLFPPITELATDFEYPKILTQVNTCSFGLNVHMKLQLYHEEYYFEVV